MNPFIELAEVAATFYGLYQLSLLAELLHNRRRGLVPVPVAGDGPGSAPQAAVVAQARDTEPYRMDAGVAVSGPEPGRHENVEVSQ